MSWSAGTRVATINSATQIDSITHNFAVTSELKEKNGAWGPTGGGPTGGHTLSVKLEVESCALTSGWQVTITNPTVNAMSTPDWADATQTITDAGDSKGDGTCGKRTYTIVESATYPWVTLSATTAY